MGREGIGKGFWLTNSAHVRQGLRDKLVTCLFGADDKSGNHAGSKHCQSQGWLRLFHFMRLFIKPVLRHCHTYNRSTRPAVPPLATNWTDENTSTACGHRMAYRKWREIKLQPGTAVPGNMLGSCLVSFHILWANLCPQAVEQNSKPTLRRARLATSVVATFIV